MSVETNILASDHWYQGEDKVFTWAVVNASGVALDISTYALQWILTDGTATTDSVRLTKATGGTGITAVNVNGTNDGARVQIDDTDTIAAIVAPATEGVVQIAAGTYHYELWRTDAGSEGVLAYGTAVLLPARRR